MGRHQLALTVAICSLFSACRYLTTMYRRQPPFDGYQSNGSFHERFPEDSSVHVQASKPLQFWIQMTR